MPLEFVLTFQQFNNCRGSSLIFNCFLFLVFQSLNTSESHICLIRDVQKVLALKTEVAVTKVSLCGIQFCCFSYFTSEMLEFTSKISLDYCTGLLRSVVCSYRGPQPLLGRKGGGRMCFMAALCTGMCLHSYPPVAQIIVHGIDVVSRKPQFSNPQFSCQLWCSISLVGICANSLVPGGGG